MIKRHDIRPRRKRGVTSGCADASSDAADSSDTHDVAEEGVGDEGVNDEEVGVE